MRNLKFRIDFGYNKLYDDDRYVISMDGGLYYHLGKTDGTIQLFTGITDKNGVEIYEGDIIQFEKYPSPYGYGHEDDEPDIVKCEVRWVDCGLKACWGHEFCNEERIHSDMEVVFENNNPPQ